MPHPRILFLVADAAKARFVARDHESGHFATYAEVRAGGGHATPARGTVHESMGHQRHGLGERKDMAARKRDQFATELAQALEAEVKKGKWETVALVAPARILNGIEDKLPTSYRAKIHATLAKDLAKIGDHALTEWLTPLELTAARPASTSVA